MELRFQGNPVPAVRAGTAVKTPSCRTAAGGRLTLALLLHAWRRKGRTRIHPESALRSRLPQSRELPCSRCGPSARALRHGDGESWPCCEAGAGSCFGGSLRAKGEMDVLCASFLRVSHAEDSLPVSPKQTPRGLPTAQGRFVKDEARPSSCSLSQLWKADFVLRWRSLRQNLWQQVLHPSLLC